MELCALQPPSGNQLEDWSQAFSLHLKKDYCRCNSALELHGSSAQLLAELPLLTSCPKEFKPNSINHLATLWICVSLTTTCSAWSASLLSSFLCFAIPFYRWIKSKKQSYSSMLVLLSCFSASWNIGCVACSALSADQVPLKSYKKETKRKYTKAM